MSRRRKLLLALGILLLLILLVPPLAFYWRARHALPQYDGEARAAGLQQPVRILRDERAVPHIYAKSADDLLFAQGYVHAQERLWQMDLSRRAARGQLAEVLGPAAVELDKENRILGLGAAADRAAAALEPEARRELEAYARGVNAFIEQHPGSPLTAGLPVEFALLRYRPEPWTPADSLAIGLNMHKLLTNMWRRELARARVSERVGPELAADLYVSTSQHDRIVAVPVQVPVRQRPRRSYVATNCRHSIEEILSGARPVPARAGSRLSLNSEEEVGRSYGASNNWVAGGARTASGAAMLADDMHLPHTVPPVWFINHLSAPEVDVAGFSLPGVPWVIAGHNRRIAWGFTNLGGDVQDLYIERFNPDDSSLYMTPTGWQPVRKRTERIRVRGKEDIIAEILETRHGPIVHEDGDTRIALQWTALDPALISFPFGAVNRARDWEEFTRAFRGYGGPAQNVVYADADGNIGYHAAGKLPLRRTDRGEAPVPGDTSVFDWIGTVPFEAMPHNFNPTEGILATANSRVVPEGYAYDITDHWVAPWRTARIYELLEENRKFAREDFLRIQGDVVSLPDRFLAEQLVAAGNASASILPAAGRPERRTQALAALREFDGAMTADSLAALVTDTTRGYLMEELLRPHLGDDWRSYSWFMSTVFLENVLRQRPKRWLPEKYPSYDELLLAALDSALDELQGENNTPLQNLRWGEQRRVQFAHPVGGQIPILRRWFSLGGDPQSGGPHTPKQTHRAAGVSERLVVDFSDLDGTLMNVTIGQSGHVASPHYRDQYQAWLEVRSFPAPFTDGAVERAARHTLHLLPQ